MSQVLDIPTTAAPGHAAIQQRPPVTGARGVLHQGKTMKHLVRNTRARSVLAAALFAACAAPAQADVVTDWNLLAGEILVEAKIGTPPAIRVMAIVQTAVHEAVQATAGQGAAQSPASIEAAVAAAHRATLSRLLPAQQASIDAASRTALAAIAEGPAKTAGIAAGERAAAAVLAARADDGAAAPDAYRPQASAGRYVPTASPAAPHWGGRKPWLLTSTAQFRPEAPPALTSAAWARDYDEVKALGGKGSTQRSAEQTEIARFWEYSLPPIYHGVLRSMALAPGRDVARNARFFAAAAQAMDDAMIAVFDAKYRYGFWRPTTAIRNGDIDGNDATERDAAWAPFIDVPLHPEYPSAHAILAGTVGALVQAEAGTGPMPLLTTTSPSAKGAVRQWRTVADFTQEVSNARVYEGVHYRFSTETGTAMGQRIGELAAARWLALPHERNVAAALR